MNTPPTNNAAVVWKNRIVSYKLENPKDLKANPANFRKHPAVQREALRGSLNELGWVQAVVVNQNTGNVVDGHARLDEALQTGRLEVPVLYVDLSLEEEKKVLVVLDQITEMARRDGDAMAEVLASVNFEDQGLAALIDSLKEEAETGVNSIVGTGDDGGEQLANFNATYLLVFDTLKQQEAWFTFLEKLRAKWPDMETIAERILTYVDENEVMSNG